MRSLWRRGRLSASSWWCFVLWRTLGVVSNVISIFMALGIVITISALPTTIFVSCLCRPSTVAREHPVDHTIHQEVLIFTIVLVGIPMRGSIGERISLFCLLTRRRPRTLFTTHIGSSRVMSTGVISGRKGSGRAIRISISRRVSRVMSGRRS